MTTDRPATGVPDVEVIARVLAEHPEGRWSNGSTLCSGCFARLKRHQDANPAPDAPGREAAYRELVAVMEPGWDTAQWRVHVAEHIAAALNSTATTPEETP